MVFMVFCVTLSLPIYIVLCLFVITRPDVNLPKRGIGLLHMPVSSCLE